MVTGSLNYQPIPALRSIPDFITLLCRLEFAAPVHISHAIRWSTVSSCRLLRVATFEVWLYGPSVPCIRHSTRPGLFRAAFKAMQPFATPCYSSLHAGLLLPSIRPKHLSLPSAPMRCLAHATLSRTGCKCVRTTIVPYSVVEASLRTSVSAARFAWIGTAMQVVWRCDVLRAL